MYRVTYRGQQYPSLKSLHARQAAPGVSYGLFRRRVVTLGWDTDSALRTPAKRKPEETDRPRFTVRGDTLTLRQAYDRYAVDGLTFTAFSTRIRDGWEIDDALETPQMNQNVRTYVVDGVTFPNLKALAREARITYTAAYRRMKRGWSDREIFHGRDKRTKPIVVDGVDYGSARKAYEALKPVTRLSTIKGRLANGWSPDQAFELVPRPNKNAIPVTVAGVEYESLSAAYTALSPSKSFNTVRQRVRQGKTLEEALEVVENVDGRTVGKRIRKLCVQGKYFSVSQASRHFGVHYNTILNRLNRGASSEQAVGLARIERGDLLPHKEAYRSRKKQRRKTYRVDNTEYDSIAALARAYSLDPHLVYNRIRTNGWSPEKAVTEQVSEPVIVNGKSYRSAMNAWEQIGETSEAVFASRKAAGHPLEVCLGLAPLPKQNVYRIEGQEYHSLTAVADAFEVSETTLNERLRRMNIEEAVRHRPINGKFNQKRIDEDPQLGNTPAVLYFVILRSSDGDLHKIGITTRSIAGRFRSEEVTELFSTKGTLREMFELEQAVLREFSDNLYRSDEDFDGRTETLLLLQEEERMVLEFIQELRRKQRSTWLA